MDALSVLLFAAGGLVVAVPLLRLAFYTGAMRDGLLTARKPAW